MKALQTFAPSDRRTQRGRQEHFPKGAVCGPKAWHEESAYQQNASQTAAQDISIPHGRPKEPAQDGSPA
jgi:hypothetical protein